MQTPFGDRLYTNYTPLHPEIEQIHRVIAGPLEDISRLDGKISRLQAIIGELFREREALSSFVDAHRALLSTIRRLPPELLQKIFTHCLVADRNRVDAFKSRKKAPILLGHVCSSWRRLAMSTPELWSSLRVIVPDLQSLKAYGTDTLSQHGKLVERWLELSGHHPLSISFSCRPVENMQEVDLAAASLFQILIAFSQRWKNLDLCLPLFMFVRFFATISEADVPLLKSIRLIPYDPSQYMATSAWQAASIFRVSHLRSLSLSGLDISLLVPNWNHLAYLNLEGDSWDRILITTSKALETLSSCTNLISCKMSNVKADDTTSFSTISLPLLRSLDIMTEGGDLTAFFGVLKVPGLRSFKYCNHFHSSDIGTPFKSILSQSHSPGIESIELSLVSLPTVAECLPLVPFLKCLSIRDKTRIYLETSSRAASILDDDILARLTPLSDSGECLCPCLEEIEFYNCTNITNDALCIFFTARTSHPAVARLKSATFSFPGPPIRDITPELEQLELNGLSVSVTYDSDEWV